MGATASPSETRRSKRAYRCYLLRCWLEEGAGPCGEPAWRFTVRQTDLDAARLAFSSLHDLTVYIETELAACTGVQQDADSQRAERGSEFEDRSP